MKIFAFIHFWFYYFLWWDVRSWNIELTLHCKKKMKSSIKDFFSKCGQIRRFLRSWSHLLKKSFMGNFIFCAVLVPSLQIKPRKYTSGKYLWHRFWKGESLGWDSKQNEWLWRRWPKGSIKIMLWKNLQNLQENICARVCFLINFNIADLQLH